MESFVFDRADILLPKEDPQTWSVVACDQFTSQPEYWQQVEAIVGDAPSALRVTLPEIYLEGDVSGRIQRVNQTMETYQNNGVLEEYKDSMILVHRTTESGTRKGIVGKIRLTDYDYHKGSHALIRATEETVLERIPPRVQIRKEASLELPHVLLLMDDPTDSVLSAAQPDRQVYDFDMMQKGGHMTGWTLSEEGILGVKQALKQLMSGDDPLLFVVGDGNHSLATAKECAALNDSQEAQYALVEIVNVHDHAIQFEPIYRVLFHVDANHLVGQLKEALGCEEGQGHPYTLVTPEGEQTLWLKKTAQLPVATLQPFLDDYLKANPGVKIDYIHGDDILRSLCRQPDTLGFIFQGMEKDQLFPAVRKDGSLPRKTFSMGHAHEKRYYMEARKIK